MEKTIAKEGCKGGIRKHKRRGRNRWKRVMRGQRDHGEKRESEEVRNMKKMDRGGK